MCFPLREVLEITEDKEEEWLKWVLEVEGVLDVSRTFVLKSDMLCEKPIKLFMVLVVFHKVAQWNRDITRDFCLQETVKS